MATALTWVEARAAREHGEPYRSSMSFGLADFAKARIDNHCGDRDEMPLELWVVEGADRARRLHLHPRPRPYRVGATRICDLALDDPGVSAEHVELGLVGDSVAIANLGASPVYLGRRALGPREEAFWRSEDMLQVGGSVLAPHGPIARAVQLADVQPPETVTRELEL